MKKTIEELQNEATAKGIKFDRRWGVKKLQRKIDNVVVSDDSHVIVMPEVVEEEEKQEKKPYKIKNMSANRYEIGAFILKSMETIELSKEHLQNSDLMKRINRHIEIKKFKVVE